MSHQHYYTKIVRKFWMLYSLRCECGAKPPSLQEMAKQAEAQR